MLPAVERAAYGASLAILPITVALDELIGLAVLAHAI